MADALGLLLGMVLLAIPVPGIPTCSSDGELAIYHACNLSHVPQVPITTKRLLMSYNSVRILTNSSFPLLEHLWMLELGSQKTPLTLDRHAFQNLPSLKVLDLGLTQLDFLHPDAFQGLPHLTELRLFGCGLSEAVLMNGHFRNLGSLVRLDLSSNQIKSLSLHPSFGGLNALAILDFTYNQIASMCESDLWPLQGRGLSYLSLASNTLLYRSISMDWGACGNPLRNMSLGKLDLSNNGWPVALVMNFNQAIHGSQVTTLLLHHHIMGPGFGYHNLAEPDQSTFAGLTGSSVRILDLSYGYIFSLKPYLFKGLQELMLLDLSRNKINKIEDNAFSGLDKLQVLNMSYNLLGELYDSNFKGLWQVVYIDLQNNHIGLIQQQTFSLLKHLQTLDLRDNALRTISFLQSIERIFLGGNKLAVLPNVKFTTHFLHLTENRLQHLAHLYLLLQIPNLQVLIVNQNRLSFCDPNLSPSRNPSLEKLFLNENMLQLAWESQSCWDMFQGLSGLQVLYLNNNYLSFLPPEVFSHLTVLRELSLNTNRLTVLSLGDLPASLEVLDVSRNQLLTPDPKLFASLRFLDIRYNKFICECELIPLLLWLNSTNVTLLGTQEDMSCTYPHWMAGTPISELPTGDCDEEKALRALRFVLFLFFMVTLTLFLVATLTIVKFRGFCFFCYQRVWGLLLGDGTLEPPDDAYRYDAYLCFSSKDFEWVHDALLQHLDSQYSPQNRFNLYFEERDFVPGKNHMTNIQEAVWHSRKTVCVVSRHFLRDGWCLEAFAHAQSRCLSDLSSALVVLVVGSLSQYQLMRHPVIRAFVLRRQYLRWPEDPQDVDWFLSKLSQHILKKEEPRKNGAEREERDNGLELSAMGI